MSEKPITYYSLNQYLKDTFGSKVYKIALNGGFTCPNRDGKLDTRGCIFCSAGGSGDFAESPDLSITEQIEAGKRRVSDKIKDGKYIAYFQAYTNTYGPLEKMRKLFTEAILHPDIVAVSVATRPDCLGEDVLNLLSELNRIKPVWVELGLQTIHEKSAEYIRRGYPLSVYEEAVNSLKKRDLNVITHVILGLPGETFEDMKDTVRHVCECGTDGIKLQLLHVLKGTDLARQYEEGKFEVMEEEEYLDLISELLQIIPKNIVIHRLTGDGPKKDLIAPLWSADKKHVLNRMKEKLKR
ncbi:MAG: TIGR01212 family radical SAM protein [Lachnospiraceae bacterium]|nr:TIGR01212 family radical SAM protein [Lachnospiraceae bacterium]